jgi:hypothetical protein
MADGMGTSDSKNVLGSDPQKFFPRQAPVADHEDFVGRKLPLKGAYAGVAAKRAALDLYGQGFAEKITQ